MCIRDRGIIYLLTHQHALMLVEFSPTQVKQAVTGYGGAQKDQVARVIKQLFGFDTCIERYDVTDALAVALCGAWQKQSLPRNIQAGS